MGSRSPMGGLGTEIIGMNTILVTGNEGYIGSVLTPKLHQKGYHVIGLDLGIFRDAKFISTRSNPAKQIYKDVRDITPDDLKGINAVVHLAALSNDPLGELHPDATYDINYRASVRLAELAKEAGVRRFLFSSSCSIYGAAGDGHVREDGALAPQTPYAESKVLAERDIARLADLHFCPIFLRNATVFGISPRMRLDLVVQNLAARGFVEGVITVLSDGTPWRPLVHIEDVTEAFLFFLEAPEEVVRGGAYNVGHRENNVRVNDIARTIAAHMPRTRIEIKNENPVDKRSYRVDFSKLYAMGLRPQHTLMQGTAQICRAFEQCSLNAADLDSDRYITLKRYQRLQREKKMDNNLRMI